MGNPGPPPTPTRLKLLRGTLRPDRDRGHEPQPSLGPVAMPRGVLPASARKAWRTWAPELQQLGLLTPIDRPMFALTCLWAGVAMDAARLIRDEDIVTEDDRGRERKSRALTVLRAASSELRQLSAMFGLSPADRSRINTPKPEERDPFAEFLGETEQMVIGRG